MYILVYTNIYIIYYILYTYIYTERDREGNSHRESENSFTS